MNGINLKKNIEIIDAEVHLLPPEWCLKSYTPPVAEKKMMNMVYFHKDRDLALNKAYAEVALEEMEKSGVDAAVIMGMPWLNWDMCVENNLYIMKVIEKYPDKFTGFGILPPKNSRIFDYIKIIKQQYGFRGVKIIPEWQNFKLMDSNMFPVYETLIENDLVLMSHIDHGFYDPNHGTSAFELYSLALKFPELKILAPHLGGLLCLYNLFEPMKKKIKNICFITSVEATVKMIKYAVDAAPKQIVFGTDYPFNLSHCQSYMTDNILKEYLDDPETLQLIVSDNIRKFLNWQKI